MHIKTIEYDILKNINKEKFLSKNRKRKTKEHRRI